jgi:hypothetical protein
MTVSPQVKPARTGFDMYKKLRRRFREYRINTAPIYRQFEPNISKVICDSRCAISPTSRFVYFRIPKAANSTVVASLYRAETGRTPENERALNLVKRGYRRPSSLGRGMIRQVMDDYYKFTIVRNPYSRVVSAYLDKIAGRQAPYFLTVARFLGREPNEAITFSEFVDYLEFGSGLLADPHWCLQTDLIFLPLEQLDFVGKFERLSTDLAHILEAIFPGSNTSVNWNPHATGADKKTQAILDAASAARIAKLYEKDFDLLHYPTQLSNGAPS